MIDYKIHGEALQVIAPAITPFLLRDLSEQLMADYVASGSQGKPFGKADQTYDGRLYTLQLYAHLGAKKMRLAGIDSAQTFWGFSVLAPLVIQPGQRVILPVGLETVTRQRPHPSLRERINERERTVEIEGVTEGYYDSSITDGNPPWVAPRIHWSSMSGKATHSASSQMLADLLNEARKKPADEMAP